jgi:hypothetical protein
MLILAAAESDSMQLPFYKRNDVKLISLEISTKLHDLLYRR